MEINLVQLHQKKLASTLQLNFEHLLPDKSVEERMDSFPSFKITKQEDDESNILRKRYPDEFEYKLSKRRFKCSENTRSIDFCTPTTLFSTDLFGTSSFGRRAASLVGESLLIPDEKKCTEINYQLPRGNEVRRSEKWIEQHKYHAPGSSSSGSLSTELHTSSRRPDVNPFVFSELQGRCSFSKVFFQEQAGNEGSKFSAKSMFLYSERRQDCKKDDKGSRTFGHFHLQMLTREVDERPLQIIHLPEYRKHRLLKKFGKFWNWHRLHHGLEETFRSNTRNYQLCTTFSCDSKEKDLFKMHNLPSDFSCHDKSPEENPHMIQDSAINKVVEGDEKDDFDTNHVQDESRFGTNSKAMNTSKGFTSSKLNKHPLMLESNNRTRKAISGSQIKQQSLSRNPPMKLLNLKMKQTSCLNKMVQTENVEVNTTSKMSPDTNNVVSNVQRLEISYSHNPSENATEPEPSSRWIKRLKLQQVDQEFTMYDASSSRRTHKLLTRVLNYSRSNSDFTIANHLEEEKQPIVNSVRESSMESLKNSYSWIRRWCRRSQNQSAGSSKIMADGNSTRPEQEMQVPSKSEPPELNENSTSIQFPSMAGLALMGKAISNFKPCEFRKRGTSLVWDTEEVQL